MQQNNEEQVFYSVVLSKASTLLRKRANMRIASVGVLIQHPMVDRIAFSSSASFLDYDVLIWDPNTYLNEYKDIHSETYRGYLCLGDDESVLIQEDILRRLKEIVQMLELGRSIIIFTPEPQKCYVATGEKQYSGTGRNRQTTRMVGSLDLLSAIPIKDVKTVLASGTGIELRAEEPFKSFWNKTKDHFNYRAYFETPVGKPLFVVKGTQMVVGALLNLKNGNLVFLPMHEPKKNKKVVNEGFIDALIELINSLKQSTGDFELPAWSSGYILPQEQQSKSDLSLLEGELAALLKRIADQKDFVASLQKYKILFTGSGKALEVQVKKVFEELGLSAKEGVEGRDDLILQYDEQVAVVEVKGVAKSAAEKHAAQLEKWVSEHYAAHGVMPKGILVVNAFKDTPLKDRKEASFPNQMLDYCRRREHCLITGTQLLLMYLDCKDDEEKRKQMIELMFSTNGIFPEYQDWTILLEMEEQVTAE